MNLMEWLAVDMSVLATTVGRDVQNKRLADALVAAGHELSGKGILTRLKIVGRALATATDRLDHPDFERLASHRSDIVRQWACYAVNEPVVPMSLEDRLHHTRRYAADTNMSVREAAWMAFRPHLAARLVDGLKLLEPLTQDADANVRRFAIEVSRPRSVWGAHIADLKATPRMAAQLLENTRADSARYVRLALGNWLNDASKSRPEWVLQLCKRWSKAQDVRSDFVIKRATRTIGQVKFATASSGAGVGRATRERRRDYDA